MRTCAKATYSSISTCVANMISKPSFCKYDFKALKAFSRICTYGFTVFSKLSQFMVFQGFAISKVLQMDFCKDFASAKFQWKSWFFARMVFPCKSSLYWHLPKLGRMSCNLEIIVRKNALVLSQPVLHSIYQVLVCSPTNMWPKILALSPGLLALKCWLQSTYLWCCISSHCVVSTLAHISYCSALLPLMLIKCFYKLLFVHQTLIAPHLFDAEFTKLYSIGKLLPLCTVFPEI